MSSEPDKESPRIGRVVTFYSFKGGVGRSMALANISLLLSALCLSRPGGRSKDPRILVIDFDLEAPGLELYLLATSKKPSISQIQSRPGLVDLLKGLQDGKQLDWRSCITEIRINDHTIDFLGSGRKNATQDFEGESDYIKSLQSLSWEKLFSEGDLGRYLEGLRDQWTQTYDYILVDSRTGASDTGDICTILLPDILVTLFVMNKQNIDGVSRIAKRAREIRQKLPIDRSQLIVVPIAARREMAEYETYRKWEDTALSTVAGFYRDWLPERVSPSEALRVLSFPYIPIWSFGERLPVIEGPLELQDPSSLSSAYARLARLIHSEFEWDMVSDELSNGRLPLGANTFYEEREKLVASRDYIQAFSNEQTEKLSSLIAEKSELSALVAKRKSRNLFSVSVALACGMAVFAGLAYSAFQASIAAQLSATTEELRSLQSLLESRRGFEVDRGLGLAALLSSGSVDLVIYVPVVSFSISPDGSRIVSGGGDGTLRLWDAVSGAALGEPLRGHESQVFSVAFSPDGSRIVSGSGDDTLRLWDATSGAALGEPLRGHEGSVWSVAFSPDGRRIVSGSFDRTLRLWDADTGAVLGEPLRGHEGSIFSVAFSPDGSRIVSGGWDDTLRLWDATTSAALGGPMYGHEGIIHSVAFSPDGRRIVSGGFDGTLRIWDAATGAALGEPMHGHERGVRSVAFSPDGNRIVSGDAGGALRLWDAANGAALGEPLRGHEDWINRVAFSPDGNSIVIGGSGGILRWRTPQ